MKYNDNQVSEKSRMLRHRETTSGYPLWFSPKTGKYFQMSNHLSQEVAAGTLKKIKKAAGI